MPIKFLVFGEGRGLFGTGGGWKCQFYFYGRGDFSECSCVLFASRRCLASWLFSQNRIRQNHGGSCEIMAPEKCMNA